MEDRVALNNFANHRTKVWKYNLAPLVTMMLRPGTIKRAMHCIFSTSMTLRSARI